MRNWIFTLFIGMLTSLSHAQDSVSVLFIGNSYTYSNNLPAMINSIANSFGDQISWVDQTAGGSTLLNHAANPQTYVNINSRPWDFVVIQAQSQEPSFPDSQVNAETIPYAIQMADSAAANRFCTDVLFFMTWGRKDGDPQWGPISTFEGMNSRLRSAYMRMADSVQGSISPVGSAWAYVRENYPSLGDSLYTSDGSHPSPQGSYLAACTFYASMFRESPVGSSYTAGLTATTVGILQQAAALTVLDSLDQWNLRPISEFTQADFLYAVSGLTVDFTNLSTSAQTYSWDFGNGFSSTDQHPSYTFVSSGTHDVTLVASSECDSDTIQYTITLAVNVLSEENAVYGVKYLGDGVFQIQTMEPKSFELFSADGKYLAQVDSGINLDLSAYGKGIYLLSDGQGGVIRLPYLAE